MSTRPLATYALARRLASSPTFADGADAACEGLAAALAADGAFLRPPGPRADSAAPALHLSGRLAAALPGPELATALAGGSFARWLRRRGVAASASSPIRSDGDDGLVAVAWRRPPSDLGAARAAVDFIASVLGDLWLRWSLESTVQRLRAEQDQRRDQIVELQHLAAVGELASGVVHDVNNALTTVVGLSDWLLTTISGGWSGRREIETINTAALDAAAVLRRFHQFCRPDPGGRLPAPLDLAELVEQLPDLVEPRLRQAEDSNGISIDVRVSAPGVGQVLAAPAEIREVLLNLAFNAIEAMPGGGRLLLETRRAGTRAQVVVSDTGRGMTDEVRTRAFERYFTTRPGRGSGLGLAVSRAIAERHGGTLEVESAPGAGTRAILSLPVAEPCTVSADRAATTGVGPEVGPGLAVLVVDDQPDVCTSIGEMLEALGHTAALAGSGAEALALAESRPFDVIMTDLGMSGMNGLELAGRLRERPRKTPVILVTGWAGDLDPRAFDAIALVLLKPLTMSDLKDALARVAGEVAA